MNYIQARTIECANYMLQNQLTVRKTAKHFNLAKSTLHSDIHKHLPLVHPELYKQITNLMTLNYNQKHIRGGQSTKLKYSKNK